MNVVFLCAGCRRPLSGPDVVLPVTRHVPAGSSGEVEFTHRDDQYVHPEHLEIAETAGYRLLASAGPGSVMELEARRRDAK